MSVVITRDAGAPTGGAPRPPAPKAAGAPKPGAAGARPAPAPGPRAQPPRVSVKAGQLQKIADILNAKVDAHETKISSLNGTVKEAKSDIASAQIKKDAPRLAEAHAKLVATRDALLSTRAQLEETHAKLGGINRMLTQENKTGAARLPIRVPFIR